MRLILVLAVGAMLGGLTAADPLTLPSDECATQLQALQAAQKRIPAPPDRGELKAAQASLALLLRQEYRANDRRYYDPGAWAAMKIATERRIAELTKADAAATQARDRLVAERDAAAQANDACEAAVADRIAAERAAREEAARQHADRIARLTQDPKVLRLAASGMICAYQERRRMALAEIAAEKKYARNGGGIVDKAKLYELQGDVREADEAIAELRASVKKAKPVGCKDKVVRVVAMCLLERDASIPECTAPAFTDAVDVAAAFYFATE